MRRVISSVCVASALLLSAQAASAAVVVSGPTGTTALLPGGEAGGVRYRELACQAVGGNCNDAEQYLGSNLGSNPANTYTQGQVVYGAANPFTFSYNAVTDVLSSTINGATITRNSFLANLAAGVVAQNFDTLSIFIRDGAIGQGVTTLTGLNLVGSNGNDALGNFTGSENASNYWSVTGANFKQSFTLTGTLNRSGTYSQSAETNKVEFLIGNGPIGAVPEPATWAMMIAGFGMIGAAMRRRGQTARVSFA